MRLLYISMVLVATCAPAYVCAQEDDIPLGDVARALRSSKTAEQNDVIDNDNLDRVMDKAESERLDGQPVFAITHTGALVAVSADGSCNLSFDARSVNHTSGAYITTDLPQTELANLDGPAAIRDGMLSVSVHNGTQWDLKEIVIGLTVTPAQSAPAEYRFATLQSAPVDTSEKLPEPTVLYHLRGSALPNSTSIFRASLDDSNEAFSVGKDWHWSIVGARGIPPAAQSLIAAHNSLSAPALISPEPQPHPEILETNLPGVPTPTSGSRQR
jgi:hypothetical protein